MQDFKRGLDLTYEWRKDWAIYFFQLAFTFKKCSLSNGFKHVQNIIETALK